MKIAHVVGTRPNFMKVAPVMTALSAYPDVEQLLIHTGQHYDRSLSDVFFEDLELPYPDHFLEVGSATHPTQTARVMLAIEPVLGQIRPDLVLVPGDVNSTLAAALAATQLGLPVAHLEAGLRSRDRAMPEETNRILTDHISELLLTPSQDADQNLIDEGIPSEQIAFVGNTMIDSLITHRDRAASLTIAAEEFSAEDYLLVTLHRPSLVDDPEKLRETMLTLERVAESRPVLFPVHPRTRAALDGWQSKRVELLEPQSYLRFLSLLLHAGAVLTDSGGIQEETTVLGVPCFTLRTTTERPITISEGTNTLLGTGEQAFEHLEAALAQPLVRAPRSPEGWDGQAAERVALALRSFSSI